MMASKPDVEQRTVAYPRDMKDPKDWLHFVQVGAFESSWSRLDLDDEDLSALELFIMLDPSGPPIVPGTGGVRKIRFASERWSSGKRSGVRVFFAYWEEFGLIALIYAQRRKDAKAIAGEHKKELKQLVTEIEQYLRNGSRCKG
jgi:hypothetical protein